MVFLNTNTHKRRLHTIWATKTLWLEAWRNLSPQWFSIHRIFFFFFCFLGSYLGYTQVPRLGAELSLQLPAYATARATATQDPSNVCNLHHSSRPRWILNPLSEARDQTRILMDTSQVRYHWATTGTPTGSLEDITTENQEHSCTYIPNRKSNKHSLETRQSVCFSTVCVSHKLPQTNAEKQ